MASSFRLATSVKKRQCGAECFALLYPQKAVNRQWSAPWRAAKTLPKRSPEIESRFSPTIRSGR
jgi:hypothetical protein